MKHLFVILILNISILNASTLTLNEAIEVLKEENLEIKSATLEVKSATQNAKTASGSNWGKLDFIQDFANSDDAGNVFGFKLTSREATFRDFGAAGFPSIGLDTPPDELNYPDSHNFFQSKLKYEIPVFTGFKISSYENILNSMTKMKKLEKTKLMQEKVYELKKSFYDMALLQSDRKSVV